MAFDAYQHYLESLRQRRAPAMAEAARLIDAGAFDQAERLVRAVDDSIYGAVALADLYRAVLVRSRQAAGVPALAGPGWRQEVCRRAVRWACDALPDPHTAVEAAQYEQARRRAQAELEHIFHAGADGQEGQADARAGDPARGAAR